MKKTTYKKKQQWELPNPWHFQQKLRGGRVHADKTKVIARKQKNVGRNREWGRYE